MVIVRYIKLQAEKRENALWQTGLRHADPIGNKPTEKSLVSNEQITNIIATHDQPLRLQILRQNHYLQKKDKIQNRKGLREIILKRNCLGEVFMEALSSCLRYDRFIKVIDLQANLIPDSSIKSLVKSSLKENQSLVSFTVVKNPGLTEKTRKQIALYLLKNIEAFRQGGVEIKEEWIKHSDLAFKIPQRILDNLGIHQRSTDKSINDYTTQTTHNEEQVKRSHSNSQRQKSTGRKAPSRSRSGKSRNKGTGGQNMTTVTTAAAD